MAGDTSRPSAVSGTQPTSITGGTIDEVSKSVAWLNDEAGNPFTSSNPLPVILGEHAEVDAWQNKFGDNPAVAGTEYIWELGTTDGWYVPAGSACTVEMAAGAETGTLTVTGILTADGSEVTETKAMTGTTPVALDHSYKCIYRMSYDSGGLDPNVAQILAKETTGPSTIATIGAGQGQTLQAFYVVPTDYSSARLIHFYSQAGKGDEISGELMIASSSWRVRHKFRGTDQLNKKWWGSYDHPEMGILLAPGDLVKVRAVRVGGTRMSAGFIIALYL